MKRRLGGTVGKRVGSKAKRAFVSCGLLALALHASADAGAQPKPPTPPGGPVAGKPTGKPGKGGKIGTPDVPKSGITIKVGPAPKPEDLWVAGSSNEWVAQLQARALREAQSGGRGAIGALHALSNIADSAKAGAARTALERIATLLASSPTAEGKDLGREALLLARAMAPDVGTKSAAAEEAKLGLISAYQLVGPFRDAGSGLDRAEGPDLGSPDDISDSDESDKPKKPAKISPKKGKPALPALPKGKAETSLDTWRKLDAQWNWGAFEVGFRPVPTDLISARGVPLEVLVHPRKESCSYLASAVTAKVDGPVILRVSASGSVRAIVDGVTVGKSDEEHALGLAERFAAKIDWKKGVHLVALKVCSGPTPDAGRARARLTTTTGAPADATFSEDLTKLPSVVEVPKHEAVATPFSRAVAVGDKPTVDDALAAAMARHFAGADDVRSPKTQGLLDVVTSTPVRPDVLAMAALATPSRASTTGWMNAALEASGSDPGYAPVARFARRVLAESRLNAGYVDWASSVVTSSELKTATDLDAQVIRARILDQLGQSEAAFAAYKGIWDTFGEQTSTEVLRFVASARFGRPALAAKARAQAEAIWCRESPRDLVASKRILGAEAVEQAVGSVIRLMSSGDDLEGLIDELRRAGKTISQRRLLLAATTLAPNRKGVWEELVNALAASSDPRDKELAKQALGRARSLDPGSPFLRAQESLAFEAKASDDEGFIHKPESFLARRKGAPKPGPDGKELPLDVYDRQLHWLRVVTVDGSGRVAQLIHYSREIVKAPKDSSDLDEPHVPAEGDVVEVVRARVHRADGTIAMPQEIVEGEQIKIRWSDLKPGDVVEVATRGYTESPIGERGAAPFYFLDYAGGPATHPVLFNEVVVRSTKKHPLYTALVNEKLGPPDENTDTVSGGYNVKRYVWKNPIAVPEEPLQPKGTEIFPTVIGSQFRTWDDFITWYRSGVESFASVDPRVRRKAEEITKGKTTRDEKIIAVFNWIADQIKYVNYVSAEQWLPNRPQKVLDRMQGDCDDKALLLMTMLKAIGVPEAEEVLVQTRYTAMPSLITAKGAVAPLFDHGIAFLPGHGKVPDRYLDATSPESRIGPLPSMDARAPAIRVPLGGGPVPVVFLPSSSPEEHGVLGKWSIALTDSGAADVSVDEEHHGDSAFFLRMQLKQAASAPAWLEKSHDVASLPLVEVLPTVEFKGDLPGGRATLKFKAKSAAIARHEGTELVVPLRWGLSAVKSLAPLVKRVTPVALPPNLAPSMGTHTFTLIPPAGYVAAELPASGEVDGKSFGRASLELTKAKDGSVVVKRTLTFDQSLITVAEYDTYRAWLQKVDALFRREVRFAKKAGS